MLQALDAQLHQEGTESSYRATTKLSFSHLVGAHLVDSIWYISDTVSYWRNKLEKRWCTSCQWASNPYKQGYDPQVTHVLGVINPILQLVFVAHLVVVHQIDSLNHSHRLQKVSTQRRRCIHRFCHGQAPLLVFIWRPDGCGADPKCAERDWNICLHVP